MNKTIHPATILFPLILLAIVCFALYFSSRPIAWMNTQPRMETQKLATISGQLVYVEKVIDGDTIAVIIDGNKTTVRFIGVNAPETYQGKKSECFADESFQYVKKRIEGTNVSLVADSTQENKDKYERLLRYILLDDGTNLNAELIKKGYAREYTYKVPYEKQQEFRSAQKDAKANSLGLWDVCYK